MGHGTYIPHNYYLNGCMMNFLVSPSQILFVSRTLSIASYIHVDWYPYILYFNVRQMLGITLLLTIPIRVDGQCGDDDCRASHSGAVKDRSRHSTGTVAKLRISFSWCCLADMVQEGPLIHPTHRSLAILASSSSLHVDSFLEGLHTCVVYYVDWLTGSLCC